MISPDFKRKTYKVGYCYLTVFKKSRRVQMSCKGYGGAWLYKAVSRSEAANMILAVRLGDRHAHGVSGSNLAASLDFEPGNRSSKSA